MATTPAKRKTKKMTDASEPFVPLTEPDEDGNYTAEIFGEAFTLNTDANGWLVMMAGSGRLSAMRDLVESLITVVPEEGETEEMARFRERDRFHSVMGRQRGFSIEDAVEFVNKLTEHAGNDLPE